MVSLLDTVIQQLLSKKHTTTLRAPLVNAWLRSNLLNMAVTHGTAKKAIPSIKAENVLDAVHMIPRARCNVLDPFASDRPTTTRSSD